MPNGDGHTLSRKEAALLHKTSELRGYHILATDGEIGQVDDFLIGETGRSTVQYLVVDTSNGIGGRSVLISATAVGRIDSPARKIHVNLTRGAIKGGPSVETAQIEPAETLPAVGTRLPSGPRYGVIGPGGIVIATGPE